MLSGFYSKLLQFTHRTKLQRLNFFTYTRSSPPPRTILAQKNRVRFISPCIDYTPRQASCGMHAGHNLPHCMHGQSVPSLSPADIHPTRFLSDSGQRVYAAHLPRHSFFPQNRLTKMPRIVSNYCRVSGTCPSMYTPLPNYHRLPKLHDTWLAEPSTDWHIGSCLDA